MAEDKYKQDGVDVLEGDKFSDFAAKLCQTTYRNSPYIEIRDFSIGHFRGPRGFRPKDLPLDSCWFDGAPDGKGTKVGLVVAAGNFQYAANGLVAMTGGDITRWGGIPLVLVNNLDTASLGEEGDAKNEAFREMLISLKNVADQQKFVMFKGETAELGEFVGSDNPNALIKFLWSAVMYGAYHENTIITGDNIKEGMIVMALRDPGLGNNGISTARAALKMNFGEDYHSNPVAQEAIRLAATPTPVYDRFLAKMNGWFSGFRPVIKTHLVVNVTGGAIPGKFGKDILYPRGLSAVLDDLWEPAPIMKNCAQWRGLTDRECYKYWHGGQRVITVIDMYNVNAYESYAAAYGISAKKVGRIIREKNGPRLTIISKFSEFSGKVLEFVPSDED